MMYVYIQSEPMCYTVGFYGPGDQWQPDSDWNTREEAARRVAWLNGSQSSLADALLVLDQRLNAIEVSLDRLEL